MTLARPASPSAAEACIPGVSPAIYSPADFRRIAAIAHEKAGIVLGEHKRLLAYSRLAPLVRESGCGTFAAFLDQVASQPAEIDRVVASLTTNHTYFNREAHHYEHFAQHVRAGLVARALAGDPVRIWSAACSSGEEIWTLAMVLAGTDRAQGRRIAGSAVRMLATDIAPKVLAAAARAEYETQAISAVPDALRTLWTTESGKTASIAAELRPMVSFRSLNLLGDWPMRRCFDVIFCRNVMIYFDQPTKERLIARLAAQLTPDGYLYIGHSERVSGPATDMLEPVGPTVYRRRAQ